jgi:hypothetical protein
MLERKKEFLSGQISIDFRFKEAYSWPAIAAHAKFEQNDWLRILNLYKEFIFCYLFSRFSKLPRVFLISHMISTYLHCNERRFLSKER